MIKPIDAIRSPGIYSARSGRLVFITQIETGAEMDDKPCIGYIVNGTPDNIVTEWGRWAVSGAFHDEGESENDVIYQV
ncbi:hypothetical protein RE432_12145 [Pusillimonas sp. SM2304]|uniref:hypothetical protein n=1 Tax=Pusillimonas sp. SM2304 TaxID=3073241 RepID=UPI002876D23F|nr:hypothetical protein [Pusillimonas sp. SM2304]MDS1141187.1 hypothetical protein [Pusillimonas sp. SM2304]